MALLRGLLDLLFPAVCSVCREAGEYPLCSRCRAAFRLIRPPVCQRCGRPLRGPPDLVFTCIPCRHRRTYFRCARARGIYDGPLRDAVCALKFGRCRAMARPLGEMVAEVVGSDPRMEADVVVPVPLHRRRLRERGFNQAELLAVEAGRLLGLPVRSSALTRVRESPPQVGLGRDERRANVRGAFAAGDGVAGVRVLLVDDVLSTGS
ncbi:MAG: ComF family protein, partial [Armatimonadota bacterium]|nr:ComF family protein [Armatimonadota bacterium]MDR7509796.1 ComF family protein [Armatimonadota bacterium]